MGEQLRTTDEFHNVPSNWFPRAEGVQEEDQTDPEDANHFLHEAPDARQNLFDALQDEGLVTGPRILDSVFIRTWFVHHLHAPQCFHSRLIEINGHWRFWHAEITGAWRDRIFPDEIVIYDIVRPNPPRAVAINQEILFDVILSQGLDAPRRAGLVTILQKDDIAGRAAFSVGVSLSERTSGHQIVQSAEYLHECNLHRCRIRHGREQIPFTMEPVHDMMDGDSFTVAVSTQNPHNDQNDAPAAPAHHDAQGSPDHDMHFNDVDSIEPSPSLASTDDRQVGVQIHRLGHLQRHGRIRWDTAAHVLIDAAAIVAQVPSDFVGFHHLQVEPDDQHEECHSIILQHHLDVAPGSTEKLILIDIEMHDPARTFEAPKAPVVSRRVYKVVPTLVRQHILFLTHTAAYCDWHAQDCLVFCNHVLWHQQERGPRQIEHGMYVRVVVPPPPSPQWEISKTISVFHDAAACFECPDAFQIAIDNLNAPAGTDSAHDMTGSIIRQAKSAELEGDIDIPMMLGPNVRMRRLRPEHDGSEDWLWDLGQIFSDTAEAEVIDGDAYLYVLTWYIDHRRHTSCSSPRPLRLDSASVAWLDEFRHLWRDLMDRRNVFSVYVVRPRPPQPRYQNYACHVLIEQNKQPGLSSGVLTALLAGSNRDAVMQGAFSTPRFIRKQDLIDIMQTERFCENRRCPAYHNQEPVHLVVATEVASVCSIRLHIDPPRDQLPHSPNESPNHFDDMSLMQSGHVTSVPNSHAIDLPEQAMEGCSYQFDAQAAAFQPGQLFISGQSEFVQDMYSQWTQIAFSWEDEAMSTDVITWFVDHRDGQTRCLQSRNFRLYSNYYDWEDLIKNAWQDLIVDGLPLEFHFVLPHPPRLEHNSIGHVILIQAPHEAWISSLVTVFDSFIGSRPQDFMRLVITTDEHVRLEHVTQACGYGNSFNANIPCQVWIDEHHLPPGILWPGRSGHNIVLQVYRQVMILPAQLQAAQGLQLLQTSVHKGVRANTKYTLHLDEVISPPCQRVDLVPVKLKRLVFDPCLPNELFLVDGFEMHEVETELGLLGHQMHVYSAEGTGYVVTVPFDWKQESGVHHYIYCQLQGSNESDGEIIFHQSAVPFDDLRHMQFLHQHDFIRAVVVSTKVLRQGLFQVFFRNNRPVLEDSVHKRKNACSPWPQPLQVIKPAPVFQTDALSIERPTHCLTLDLSNAELAAFFESASGVLCPWYRHLDLPPDVMQGINATATIEGEIPDIEAFDRLVIYTDGSSKPNERRKPPLRVAEQGTPDAWAFAVIGEKYPTAHQNGSLTLIGWQAQCVIYEDTCKAFTGTDQIGAEFSEREALLFAGLWRLALNSTIPTTFRTDSTTTADQAFGTAGFTHFHPTHELLRGTFQALQSSLGPQALDYAHVRGHAGDIWNELVDFLARTEAIRSHNLRRQQLDMLRLKKIIPYLWMLFDHQAGLPQFTQFGFDVHPPKIPDVVQLEDRSSDGISTPLQTFLGLSIATFNVSSLSVGPDGYGGKLSFLRQQMKSHALNIVGVQEARSPEGMSTAEDTLRFSSGADEGKFGVELWISLKQPYGFHNRKPLFFQKSHFQVLHNDPRRLIVRLLNPHLDCFLIVMHAPQSGQPLPIRRQWWEDTGNIAEQTCQNHPIYVMIDANAKSGPCNEPTVFQNDDTMSGNTDFLLDFLRARELCLPCTTEVHQGTNATWTSPDGLSSHRIDYVAIPAQQLDRCCHSQVLHTFDSGNSHADHAASAIQLHWETWSPGPKKGSKASTHDRTKVASCRHLLDSTPFHVAEWDCDIEHQVQRLNSDLHDMLHTACPKSRSLPKKPFITAETWQIRTDKLNLHKRLRHSRKQQSRDLLALFFRSWRGRMNQEVHNQAQAHRISIDCQHLLLTCKHWACARRLRRHLQHDKLASLNQVIADTGPQASAGTLLHTLKPFIGSTNLKKQKKMGLPIVRKVDGTLCCTPQEAQSRWIEFFAEMEGGRRMSIEEYQGHWRQGLSHFAQEAQIQMSIAELPTLTALENAFRRVSPGKAVGMDAIPPELCHFCPSSMAKKCYTIMMKAALFGQESTAHKGGQMAVAWKHRGDVRDCTSHRSLLISSHVGKTVHRALRQKFHCLYTTYLQKQQLGGRPSMPVGVPLHMSRAFHRWQTRENQPTALLFLDLTEAFYRTLRPLAIGGELSDQCIGLMCQRLGFDPDAMQELHSLLQEPSALQEAGAPAHVARVFRALHRDTWFQLGDQTDVVRTEIGSRPGDSFADIVFGFLWA